jgi:DNA-binding transcriptional LysR family regulator
MELRHLKYFLAVAEELHFGRAASRIYIAQPPLSQQIKQLEAEIGVKLFNRTKRTVELTEAGKVFQREAYAVLERLDKGIIKAQQAARGEAGWLSIGFVSSINYEILPNVLREFRRQCPDVEIFLQEMHNPEQTQSLLERRIHIGFARMPAESEDLIRKVVAREPLIVALPASNKLAEKDVLRLSDLKSEPFIVFSQSLPSPLREYILRLCAEAGFQPRIVQQVGEIQTALGLVAAEIGVTLVPASTHNLHREGVVYKNLTEPQPIIEMTMQYRKDENSPVVARFLEVIQTLYPFQ